MPSALHSPTHSSGSHTVDHHGHEELFRHRFWGSLLLTLPVLLYSHEIQSWFGFQAPAFPGSQWVPLVFSIIIFIYGGIPFLRMAVPELHNRQPGNDDAHLPRYFDRICIQCVGNILARWRRVLLGTGYPD